jgi:hypothetical protein
MKAPNMSEPISGAAASAVGLKALGGLAAGSGIGAGLAAFVVMSMTKPATDTEWRVALASTFAGSIGGGAALIKYLGIERWASDTLGLIALGGIMFACGLPAWALVRALFKYLDKRKDAGIDEIIGDGAQAVKAVKDAL